MKRRSRRASFMATFHEAERRYRRDEKRRLSRWYNGDQIDAMLEGSDEIRERMPVRALTES